MSARRHESNGRNENTCFKNREAEKLRMRRVEKRNDRPGPVKLTHDDNELSDMMDTKVVVVPATGAQINAEEFPEG